MAMHEPTLKRDELAAPELVPSVGDEEAGFEFAGVLKDRIMLPGAVSTARVEPAETFHTRRYEQ